MLRQKDFYLRLVNSFLPENCGPEFPSAGSHACLSSGDFLNAYNARRAGNLLKSFPAHFGGTSMRCLSARLAQGLNRCILASAGLIAVGSLALAGPGFGTLRKKGVELKVRQPATVRLANCSIPLKASPRIASTPQYKKACSRRSQPNYSKTREPCCGRRRAKHNGC